MNSEKPSSNKIALGIAAGIGAMVLIGAIGGGLGLHETGGIVTLLYGLAFAAIPTWVGFKVSGWKPAKPEQPKKVNTPVQQKTSKTDTYSAHDYILVHSTKKMHEPGCPYVRDLAESQYIRYNNREKALAAGYKPCKHCDP